MSNSRGKREKKKKKGPYEASNSKGETNPEVTADLNLFLKRERRKKRRVLDRWGGGGGVWTIKGNDRYRAKLHPIYPLGFN